MAAVQLGQVDLAINLPVREAVRLQGEPKLAAELDPITRIILLQLRNDLGFQDANVRLAAHHAIDKAALSRAFYNNTAVPLSQLAVHLRPEDNIAVAARHLPAGQEIQYNGGTFTLGRRVGAAKLRRLFPQPRCHREFHGWQQQPTSATRHSDESDPTRLYHPPARKPSRRRHR